MRLLYTAVLYLLAPLVLLRLFWLGRKNPDYRRRWPERFGFFPEIQFSRPVLWIHAVSVGEVQAARTLIDRLLADYAHYQLLITTVTPTGAAGVARAYGDAVQHVYCPYDLPLAVRRFLARFRPCLLLIMETELWPNLLAICRRRAVPVLLVNARLSACSGRRYGRFGAFSKETLANLSLIAAQSQADAERFLELGAPADKVVVTGNLKFDSSCPQASDETASEPAQPRQGLFAADMPIWIAASTHAGEEELVLAAFEQVLESSPNCLLILAPRHPERCEAVLELCRRRRLATARRSEPGECGPATRVFVLDTLGELARFYACSDVAFVGGSLVPDVGGHNLLEPAALGLPVISGEQPFNFAEASRLLHEAGALLFVSNPQELAREVSALLADAAKRRRMGEKAREVVLANRGATDRVMDILRTYIATDDR